MGRKAKVDKAGKLQAIKDYTTGNKSVRELCEELHVNKETIRSWCILYEAHGDVAFDEKPRNRSYTKAVKEEAVQAYKEGVSVAEILWRYEITYPSVLKRWIQRYNGHEELTDYEPEGEVYMAKSRRKTTYEERLAIVRQCLKNDRNYKKTAAEHQVSYAQVYQWVKKYDKHGEEGLRDRRGKKKPEAALSETEKLRRENERLRKENERMRMEKDVLKKFKEIERRRKSAKSGKK